MLAEWYIREEIISDNIPFNSHGFARDLGIKVSISSPIYPQSNGQAERFLQLLKNLFKKADEDGHDLYLALLEYRNTPISGLEYYHVQLLMSRTLHSQLPNTEKPLQPKVVNAHDPIKKTYYDKHAAPLALLRSGDVVRVQSRNSLGPAIVADFCDQLRLYTIQTEQALLR